MTPAVLIPRLETEVLIKRVRTYINTHPHSLPIHIVDIGTGSGIIGTSLAERADHVTLIDRSEAALNIAQDNFRTHFPDKKADFLISDLLENASIFREYHTIFVANLPYIKADDWQHMSEDTAFEPEMALFGGEHTGFELYERLFHMIHDRRLTGELFIEFGFDQRHIAEKVLTQYPQWQSTFFADYAGIERFAHISIKGEKKL